MFDSVLCASRLSRRITLFVDSLRYTADAKTGDHTDALNVAAQHENSEVPMFKAANNETRIPQGPMAVVHTLDFSA